MLAPLERTNLACAATELRAAIDRFNQAGDELAAAGRLIWASDAMRAVANCANLAAKLDLEVETDLQAARDLLEERAAPHEHRMAS